MLEINTERLHVSLATADDLSALEMLEKECDDYFVFDPPSAAEHNRSLRECLDVGDRIPGVSEEDFQRENYLLYSIWYNGIIIGWVSIYLEYRRKDAAYLSVMYIKEQYRDNKFGVEVLDAIVKELIASNYQSIRLHCSLRNAKALRFWVKCGFTKIVDVECDGNLFPENFAGIELSKSICDSRQAAIR